MMYRSYEQAKLAVSGVTFTGHPRAKFKSVSGFARKARYWSESRFRSEIAKLRRNQMLRQRYSKLRTLGVSSKQARKSYRNKKSYQGIVESLKKTSVETVSEGSQENRENKWANWASDGYPSWISVRVKKINDSMGYDNDAKFGWAYIYYQYVYNLSDEFLRDNLQVYDRFGDFYRNLIAQTVK